jgi:multiple sugar transport system substrate-binding protein
MKKRKSFIAKITALAMAFGALAACAGNDDGTATIRIGTWDANVSLGYLQQIASNFMDMNPNIRVQIESVPDGLGQAVLVQFAGGVAPDIFQIGDGDISVFQSRGVLRDLSPFINGANSVNLGDFYGPIMDIGRIDGGIYTFPKDFSTLAIYYNKDIFDAAGIPYPTNDWTWDEFRDIARRLTVFDANGKVERWGAHWIGGGVRWILPLIYANGGDVISPDGSTVLGYANGDGAIAALEWFDGLINQDRSVPSAVELGALHGVDLFLSGLAGMLLSGTWPLNSYLQAGLNFGTVALPSGPAGRHGTLAYAGYVMTKNTKNPEEAWLFMRYLVTEGQNLMAQHALSAYRPAAIAVGQDTSEHLKAFIEMVDVAREMPEILNPDWNSTAGRLFNGVLEEINLGTASNIRALLNDAAERGQAEMEEQMRSR